MATGLRVEDRLDGAANFSSWKAIIVLLFQENELWDIVEALLLHRLLPYLQMLLPLLPSLRRTSKQRGYCLMR